MALFGTAGQYLALPPAVFNFNRDGVLMLREQSTDAAVKREIFGNNSLFQANLLFLDALRHCGTAALNRRSFGTFLCSQNNGITFNKEYF